ncbi:MAG: hypothetical protein WKF84_03705 [Pyrinomonadaceae bacterium]
MARRATFTGCGVMAEARSLAGLLKNQLVRPDQYCGHAILAPIAGKS